MGRVLPVGVKPFPCGVSPEASGRSLLVAIERAATLLRCSAPAQRGKRTLAVVENRPAIADQDGFDVRIRVENALNRGDCLCVVRELGVGQGGSGSPQCARARDRP